MKEPREDDERLSALLEGRVEGRQREELLAHLSAADDDYEVFTDTAAVLRALEEEDARARTPMPPSMRKRPWGSRALRVAVYAGGAAVVLLLAVGLMMRGRAAAAGGYPVQLAMDALPAGYGLPEGWQPPTPAGGVRGGSTGMNAVYAGALLVDLSVAVRTRNTRRTSELAGELQYLSEPGAPRTPLKQIEDRPDAPTNSLNALLKRATDRLVDDLDVDRESLELGAWLEAARLAADARHAAFFQDGASRGMLRRAEALAGENAAAQTAVEQVRAELSAGGEPQWEVLRENLKTLLSQLSA